MKTGLLLGVVLLAAIVVAWACGPHPPPRTASAKRVVPCDALNQCTEAGKQCRSVDGAQLCVYVCPDNGATAGAQCNEHQFALNQADPATCKCVERVPSGRSCANDSDCGYATDEGTMAADHLCATNGGPLACTKLGLSCRTNADCPSGNTCNPAQRLCRGCVATLETCNSLDDDCDTRVDEGCREFCRDGDNDGFCAACQVATQPPPGTDPNLVCQNHEDISCDHDVREQRSDSCPDISLGMLARNGSFEAVDFPISGAFGCNAGSNSRVDCELGINFRTRGATGWVLIEIKGKARPARDLVGHLELRVNGSVPWSRDVNVHVQGPTGNMSNYRKQFQVNVITGEIKEGKENTCSSVVDLGRCDG